MGQRRWLRTVLPTRAHLGGSLASGARARKKLQGFPQVVRRNGGRVMWLSGQQKRPNQFGEGATGTVTISGDGLAVQLESERRNLELYTPGGYQWTPKVGQRVLVLKNQGENPCVVGVKQGEDAPDEVTVEAGSIDLKGQVLIDGIPLETYIAMIVASLMGG